jgi:5-methylcytosine-specific restriction endonuclease McrA
MHNTQRNLFLWCAATDKTFDLQMVQGIKTLVGKCIFCQTKLCLTLEGDPIGATTLEHIIPRSRGGTNDPENLVIACFSCNNEKGRRHDSKKNPSERAQEIITMLQERRSKRLRKPLAELKNSLKNPNDS